MITLVTVVHVIVCVFLILVILLQAGKGGGMGGAFGGAGAQTVFGGRGATTFLGKLTAGGEPWASDLGASFGCATCPGDANEAKTLFRLADEALYDAKRNGTVLRFVARQ